MTTKDFPLDEIKAVSSWSSGNLKWVAETEWSHNGGDEEQQTIIFFEEGIPNIFWQVGIYRSGSPWTDWNYEYGENWQTKMVSCVQVEQKEVTKLEWVQV